jgi:hypothetical protein
LEIEAKTEKDKKRSETIMRFPKWWNVTFNGPFRHSAAATTQPSLAGASVPPGAGKYLDPASGTSNFVRERRTDKAREIIPNNF